MFIVLMAFLIISSVLVLIAKRNKETLYIFGMCISLAVLLSGILLYIAKKGGISRELQQFLYINSDVRTYFQYLLITLDELGYIVAIGRFLFPLFLLLLAMHYSAIPWLQRSRWIKKICLLPPFISLFLYYPNIFYLLPERAPYLSSVSQVWIVGYIVVSVLLLVYEAYSIQIRFIRQQFVLIISFVLSLTILYILYFGQDPSEIYQFYIAGSSIYYIKSILSVPAYLLIVMLNVVLSVIAFASLLKYANAIFENNREEIIIQRKFNSISTGTSVFVHSIKNQLLSNRVIHKRLNKQMETTPNLDEFKKYTNRLSEQNEMMLARIEELYRSVKADRIHLTPVFLKSITDSSLEKFQKKFPNKDVCVKLDDEKVLADPVHLSEAIYNLLINAQEAVESRDEKVANGVYLSCFYTRQYVVVEVKDEGIGMSKKEMKKVFDPFYSSKNSNHNWGMGLHYVRSIVKEHFGVLRYESEMGKGTTFFMLLPKLKR